MSAYLFGWLAGWLQSLAVLLKALQGGVPWSTYCCLLASSHKDHGAAISMASYVRSLVTGVSGTAECRWYTHASLFGCVLVQSLHGSHASQ